MSLDFTPANIRTWARLGLCGTFGMAAMSLPDLDENVIILSADLSFFSGLERFIRQYPDRFYNMGIAEQNLVGVAAGFAKEGFLPFATTYATFATSRCLDQVRVSMGYMKLGIKLIGMTAGLSAGILGATHMSIEDIAAIRAIPNITIVSPADGLETVKAVQVLAKYPGPVYMRLTGGMNHPIVYKEDYHFEIGKMVRLKEGADITIIATGSMVYYAMKAAEILDEEGISTGIINVHTIKPLDVQVLEQARKTKMVVSLEEHSVYGGLGSVISESLIACRDAPPQLLLGIGDKYVKAGDYSWQLSQYGLTTESITERIKTRYSEIII